MKLAEALLERKSLMKKVESLKERINENAMIQEGDEPAEDVLSLMAELDVAVNELESLIQRINATNNVARLENGATLSQAIVQRDMIVLRRLSRQGLANSAGVRQNRYTRNEVKFVPTVNVADVRRAVDDLCKAHRELDAQIQAANWTVDLLDEVAA
jgi:hypothetical protein